MPALNPFTITVLLATYNWPKALELCLRSLSHQSDTKFDIVIADDGSTHETRELIDSLKPTFPVPITHLWHEDNGFRKSKILNLAIEKASGQYLIFLDGDCIVQPNFIQQHRLLAKEGQLVTGSRVLISESFTKELCNFENKHFELIEKNSKFGFLYKSVEYRLKGQISKLLPLLFKLPRHPFRKYSKHIWRRIKGCNMACWRGDAQRIFGFDESFEGWGHEDADFVFRLEDAGIQRISGSFATEVFHLWHRSQPSDNELVNKNRVLARMLKT